MKTRTVTGSTSNEHRFLWSLDNTIVYVISNSLYVHTTSGNNFKHKGCCLKHCGKFRSRELIPLEVYQDVESEKEITETMQQVRRKWSRERRGIFWASLNRRYAFQDDLPAMCNHMRVECLRLEQKLLQNREGDNLGALLLYSDRIGRHHDCASNVYFINI